MYRVDISPDAKFVLNTYVDLCLEDNGEDCAMRLLDSYEEGIEYLEKTPEAGYGRLQYIPSKYRVRRFWPHLWFVYQIIHMEQVVKIEYIIDDRQNYGSFVR